MRKIAVSLPDKVERGKRAALTDVGKARIVVEAGQIEPLCGFKRVHALEHRLVLPDCEIGDPRLQAIGLAV